MSSRLTVDDILADLAVLCPEDSTATQHPVLSLGRSLAPADQLASSERPREAINNDEPLSLESDANGQRSVDPLLRLLESQDSTSKADPSLRFQLIEAFLASSKETLQLNEAATERGNPGEKRVDRLNQRIAALQSQMDVVEQRLVEAKQELDKTQDTKT